MHVVDFAIGGEPAVEVRTVPGGDAFAAIVGVLGGVVGLAIEAIGLADLVAAAVASSCLVPVTVHRDYGLPAFARGKETLFVGSSHSGNTEETLDSFATALKQECTLLVISTGGELAQRAKEQNIPLWTFQHAGQPRAALPDDRRHAQHVGVGPRNGE